MDISPPCDTICAVATAIGEAGIGILKLSGPEALAIAKGLFVPARADARWDSHRLRYGWVRDPETGTVIDEVLCSYMRGPHSYTGEDVVEINCHSGYAVLDRILQVALGRGARLAEPGEFTRRAFINGRIDLTQAEAVIEIIQSRSDTALAQANRQLSGELRTRVADWRRLLLQLHAQLELQLDFSEDAEEPEESLAPIGKAISSDLLPGIRKLLTHYRDHRVLREGLALVLVGKPNVGKSSLLNQLLGKQRAIVTAIPGTTRDVIEDSFLLGGIQVRILDTAGIREEASDIEAIGIEKSLETLAEADVAVWLIDSSRPLGPEDDLIHRHLQTRPHLVLLNKVDLPEQVGETQVRRRYRPSLGIFKLCALDPEAVERFKEWLEQRIVPHSTLAKQALFIPNWRQYRCLAEAAQALQRALSLMDEGAFAELVCAEIEAARKELDRILGLNLDGELLDQIFSRFCIGK